MREQKSWTIGSLLKVTSEYLKEKNIEESRLSAEVLLAHLLNLTRIQLYLKFDRPLDEDEVSGYRALVKRRLNREPLQYITGVQEFWSLDFSVGPQVLVPRPESEVLVETALSLLDRGDVPHGEQPRILDLCTGAGALAVALAGEVGNGLLWASDIEDGALQFAKSNASRHGVEKKIQFLIGDLWEPARDRGLLFDLIVSNPPYIRSDAMETLCPEVGYEPRSALDGGEDGMRYIRKIILEGPEYLHPGGWILVEMDPEQTSEALRLMEKTGRYASWERIKDYSHRYRVVMGRKHGAL